MVFFCAKTLAQIHSIYEYDKIACCSRSKIKTKSIIEDFSYASYDLIYQKAYFKINPKFQYIEGSVYFKVVAKKDITSLFFDLHTNLQIDSIKDNNVHLNFKHDHNKVELLIPTALSVYDTLSFTVHYKGEPVQNGFGSFTSTIRKNNIPELYTLSEPYGAKDWWPCKQSLMDKVDSIDVIVECPERYRTASNGILLIDSVRNGNRIMHWKHRYPIATYLVAISCTEYAQFSDYWKYSDTDSLEILNYVYPEDKTNALKPARKTVELLELFSDLFIPYPFITEKYGHAQFSWGGGMEHQTMSFMNNLNFILVAHELAHQWFGDYITLDSWHDIWLNEGFATYLTGLAFEHMNDYGWKNYKISQIEKITRNPYGSVYVEDTTSVKRIFNGDLSYAKGAYVLHMLRWELGDSAFFKSIKNYLNDPKLANGFAGNDDLIYHLESTADTTLTEFFDSWYYGKGYPIYAYGWKQEENTLHVNIEQVPSDSLSNIFKMHLPIHVYAGGKEYKLRVHNTKASEKFSFSFALEIDSVLFDPLNWIACKHGKMLYTETPYQQSIGIYPNPTSKFINIELFNLSGNANYSIYNSNGILVQSGLIHHAFTHVDVINLAPSTYILQVNTAHQLFKQKITILR